MTSLTRNRLWWLLLCVVFVACASSPPATPTKKKKKKKKKRSDEIALKQKKDADRNDDEDQPDRPKKKSKSKDEDADDEVTVIDDDGDGEPAAKKKQKKADKAAEAAAEKKRKKEEAEAAAAEKKRKKEEEAEAAAEKQRKQEEEEAAAAAAEEAAAKKKKKKKKAKAEEEEVAAEEPVEDEEPAPKKGKKADKVAARSKKAKAKQADEDTEVAAGEPPEADEPTPAKKKAGKKQPEQVAAVDMTGSTPTPTDEPTIDMEDESSGRSLDERPDDAPPDRRAVAIPVPGVDDESETEVTAEATPVGTDPRVINERPLVLGKGKLAVHGGLRVGVLTVEPMGAPKYSKTSTGFAIGGTYGASTKSEVGLDYTLGVSPGTVKGPFALHGAYRAIDGKLDLAIAAALAVDPTPLVDFTTMQETSNTFVSLQIGAWARYRLTRKASLFSGLPALPSSAMSLTKYALPLPPQPYQLAIGINNAGTSALDVPIGLGYQINPKLYAFGALDLAHIRIANTVNAFIFRDFIPVSLGAFYVLDKLDVGATLSNDFDKGFDLVHFDTFVRYSIK